MKKILDNMIKKNHIIAHNFRGIVEKFSIPSIANLIIFDQVYDVSHTVLSGLS